MKVCNRESGENDWWNMQSLTNERGIAEMLYSRARIFQAPEELIDRAALRVGVTEGSMDAIRLPEPIAHHPAPEL